MAFTNVSYTMLKKLQTSCLVFMWVFDWSPPYTSGPRESIELHGIERKSLITSMHHGTKLYKCESMPLGLSQR